MGWGWNWRWNWFTRLKTFFLPYCMKYRLYCLQLFFMTSRVRQESKSKVTLLIVGAPYYRIFLGGEIYLKTCRNDNDMTIQWNNDYFHLLSKTYFSQISQFFAEKVNLKMVCFYFIYLCKILCSTKWKNKNNMSPYYFLSYFDFCQGVFQWFSIVLPMFWFKEMINKRLF